MGSSYFGEPSLGNGRSGSSSKKGKKSNSDKPKQPQRGLGVAQLEKIRLHHQIGCNYIPSLPTSPYHANLNQEDMRLETTYASVPSSSSSFSYSSSPSYGYHPNIMMGVREMEGTDVRYADSQSRWSPNYGLLDSQYAAQPGMTRQLLSLQMEDSVHKNRMRKDRCNSMGSSSQNSGDSSEMQELDLDLKLSL